jgi:hypothetical protein
MEIAIETAIFKQDEYKITALFRRATQDLAIASVAHLRN